jgi:microcystin-dependent protein
MSQPFIGEIRLFGGNFAPRNWAFCNGQLLSIAQNTALFSLLGTTYGGNGQTTFALPDLRGRVPLHSGQGPGLSPRTLGESSGTETVTLLASQMPAHNHGLAGFAGEGGSSSPENSFIAEPVDGSGNVLPAFSGIGNTSLNPASIGAAGGSQPHNNIQPYLCVNFIIALQGIFPSRN